MSPDIIQALLSVIELKDRCTAAHTWRVVLYSRAMAEQFGVRGEKLATITRAAALHDLGKIDIPDEILCKPGPLTDEEFGIIKTHTTLGHERLVRMGEEDSLVLGFVRHHHERADGKGYPDGLVLEEIPLAARHFAVIDTFDALTSVRPYRRDVGAEAAERALQELETGAGTRYCPESVAAFNELHRKGHLTWIREHYNDSTAIEGFAGVV